MKDHLKQRGFTLIELMIVVTIVGILAAVASPTYQSFTNRARFTQVTNATASAKTAVEICFQTTADINQCNSGLNGIPNDISPANGVPGVTINNGVIVATKALDLQVAEPGTFTLSPTIQSNGSIVWNRNCNPAQLC